RRSSELPDDPDQRVCARRLRPARLRPGDDLLLADRPPRGPRVHRAVRTADGDDPVFPWPLHARAPRGDGSARDLLALRRRDVDRRLHGRIRALVRLPRTEGEAFRALVNLVGVLAVVVAVVLLIRALS